MMPGTRAIRARSLTRRCFPWRGQRPRRPLDIPRQSLLEIPSTPCKTRAGSVNCIRRLVRSTFRPGRLTGVTPATSYFHRSRALAGGFVTFVGATDSGSWLYVLDATTGRFRYRVPIPEGSTSMMPTVVQDPISGNITAFVAEYSQVSAVSLGPVSGSVLWTQTGQFGGDSIPTVVGDSIILAGPYQYYAFDRATGAVQRAVRTDTAAAHDFRASPDSAVRMPAWESLQRSHVSDQL
jgi:hypothetical protein